MSRTATARFEWAGEERTFRLTARALEDWQEACDAGPAWVWGLLQTEMWRPVHVRETIYQGLLGGGMAKSDAARLIKLHIEPYGDNIKPAMCILEAVVQGVPDEVPKESAGRVVNLSPTFPAEKSGSPQSGDGVGQWASTSAT